MTAATTSAATTDALVSGGCVGTDRPGTGEKLPIVCDQATGHFSLISVAALFVVLLGITSIPIVLHPWPPMSDYINHLARMQVIANISSDPDLARFYEIDWQVIPNLMMDLIVPWFLRVMNVYMAGQVYTIASFVLIMSGTLVLHRQLFGRWSVLPFIGFPLLYNNVFLVGTMNYVFGIGLALWALTSWIWLRERSFLLRLPVSALFIVGLFFCHLFVVGVYGVGLLASEIHRLLGKSGELRAVGQWDGRAASRLLLDFVITGLPFLPVLPLLMMSPTWGLRQTYSWELPGKLDGLVYIIEVYSHGAAFFFTAAIAFALGWVTRHRALRFHAVGVGLVTIGIAVYMALPRVVFETYMADQRLPISLAFMLIACVDLDLRDKIVRQGFAVVLIVMLGIRVGEVEDMWSSLQGGIDSFRESVQMIDRGSKVLVAYADPDGGDDVHDLGLVHADCFALIERSALVTTAFTVVGKQIMHARPEYRGRVDQVDGTPPMINELVRLVRDEGAQSPKYWRRWTSDYDYLYVLFVDQNFENPDPEHLTTLFTGDRFVLYRIDSSQVADVRKAAK
ncbi:MAG TPA: hypothetical protein VKW08_05295 [Xanthobacteraceae bacterium]|nr:hypothetical protein [Xanthobacteraceae bacterium]